MIEFKNDMERIAWAIFAAGATAGGVGRGRSGDASAADALLEEMRKREPPGEPLATSAMGRAFT